MEFYLRFHDIWDRSPSALSLFLCRRSSWRSPSKPISSSAARALIPGRAPASRCSSPSAGFINTPSAHRVHRASNPEYLDRNFGGVLMIWDHLFGTYQGERPELVTRFGLLHPRSSPIDPFVIAYEGFLNLWRQLRRIATWRGRFAVIAGPP